MKAQQVWQDLIRVLKEMPEDADARHYYSTLASWVRTGPHRISPNVPHEHWLDRLSELDPSDYPVEWAGVVPSEEADRLGLVTAAKRSVIAMLVESQMWDMVAFKTMIDCRACGEDELRTLVDVNDDRRIVLACDFCGWAEHVDGRPWPGWATCEPAKTAELLAAGIGPRDTGQPG